MEHLRSRSGYGRVAGLPCRNPTAFGGSAGPSMRRLVPIRAHARPILPSPLQPLAQLAHVGDDQVGRVGSGAAASSAVASPLRTSTASTPARCAIAMSV